MIEGTVRQRLQELLRQGQWNSLDLSRELSVQEREIFDHLQHVKKSLRGEQLVVTPYSCQTCEYLFKSRDRLDRPGRCPKCWGTHIRMAEFSISRQG